MIAVAAMAANRVIGAEGRMPWHLPEDLRWFKDLTMGGTLLMGRVTFESIGRPLPGRRTVVLSRRGGLAIPGVVVIGDLGALRTVPPQGDVFVVGGEQIYRATLPYCRELYLTEIRREYPGDRMFPAFEGMFRFSSVVRESPDMRMVRYVNDAPKELPGDQRPVRDSGPG